jgi:WD40 repeat protein
MKFSKDGKYLAAGGQDCVLRVWEILSGKTSSQSHQRESVNFSVGNSDTIKVFHDVPIQEYRGHKADILDISWSKVRMNKAECEKLSWLTLSIEQLFAVKLHG